MYEIWHSRNRTPSISNAIYIAYCAVKAREEKNETWKVALVGKYVFLICNMAKVLLSMLRVSGF